MTDYSVLTPKFGGKENTSTDSEGRLFTAFEGTGWENRREALNMDGMRYAISIQQHRDAKDYKRADAAQSLAKSMGYGVGTAAGRTTVSGARANTF